MCLQLVEGNWAAPLISLIKAAVSLKQGVVASLEHGTVCVSTSSRDPCGVAEKPNGSKHRLKRIRIAGRARQDCAAHGAGVTILVVESCSGLAGDWRPIAISLSGNWLQTTPRQASPIHTPPINPGACRLHALHANRSSTHLIPSLHPLLCSLSPISSLLSPASLCSLHRVLRWLFSAICWPLAPAYYLLLRPLHLFW